MYGYGRFAALSNLDENEEGSGEKEVDDNDSNKDIFAGEEYEAASSPIERGDVTAERSFCHYREETNKPASPGLEDPADEAAFVSRTKSHTE